MRSSVVDNVMKVGLSLIHTQAGTKVSINGSLKDIAMS